VTSFTFTAEQIRSAPAEVRRWFESEIAAAFALATQLPAPAHSPKLTACSPEEAVRVFELINADFAAVQVFLELARQVPVASGVAPLHAFSIGEIKRHLRLSDDRLADGFGLINQAFQRVHDDPEAALFGFDQANHVYIDEITHRSIRALWEGLVQLRSSATAGAAVPGSPSTFGFTPPHVGPSEDIASH